MRIEAPEVDQIHYMTLEDNNVKQVAALVVSKAVTTPVGFLPGQKTVPALVSKGILQGVYMADLLQIPM